MSLSVERSTAAIAEHSAAFADAARNHLQAPVEHCPGWSVADLVWHLTEVHWFWGTIVEELLAEPPDDSRRPPRPEDAGLLDAFATGADRLVRALGAAEQSAACWTWAGWRQDVGFVTRHQVQEAAVHHWDAVHAAGGGIAIDAHVAADSVEEFLHFSVASDDDPDEPTTPPLVGTIGFRASDTGESWTLTDGRRPGTATVTPGLQDGVPLLEASASDLLLWLYQRVELDTSAVPAGLVGRFRGICFTD